MTDRIKYAKRIDMIADLPMGSIVAEIGVRRGHFACKMMNLPNLGHLYAIDSWKHRPEYNDPAASDDHEANYQETLHNLRGHIPGGRVTILRMDSLEAAVKFHSEGTMLDGIFIDSDHSYEAVMADLKAWSHVMKPTGLIFGHDFCINPTTKKYGWNVMFAVEKFCDESDWKLQYVTSEQFPSFGLVRK